MSEYPYGVGVVDTMIGFPSDPEHLYAVIRRGLRDRGSRGEFAIPAEDMFYDVPEGDDGPIDGLASGNSAGELRPAPLCGRAHRASGNEAACATASVGHRWRRC